MFSLTIMTPDGLFLDEMVKMITVKTTEGYLGIFPRHLPLASSIEISVMKIIHQDSTKLYAIDGGILYVDQDVTHIITPSIKAVSDIDIAEAQKELEIMSLEAETNPNDQTLKAKLIAYNKVKAVEGNHFLKVE